MITKKTKPVIGDDLSVKATVTEYRVFGILLLKKVLIMPPGRDEYVYTI